MQNTSTVVYATRWTLDSGMSGTTLHVLSDFVHRADSVGTPVAKLSGPVGLYDELTDVPAVYDLALTMAVRDGRGVLAVEHATYAGPAELMQAPTNSNS